MEELKENSHRTGDITHTPVFSARCLRKQVELQRSTGVYISQKSAAAHVRLFSASPPPQRRLGDAAKKAISKLQVRTIRKGDQETEADFDNCAVCIEGYKANDVVRILPCR